MADTFSAEQLKKAMESLTSSTYDISKKIANQSATFADVGGKMSQVFEGLGAPGRAAAAVLGDLAKYGQSSVEAWQSVSKFGLSFNNDAIGLRAASAATRMSFEDYNKFVVSNKDVLSSWGGTVTEGAKRFNELSDAYANSTAVDKMNQMGIKTEEFNDVLAVTLTSQRMTGKLDVAGKQAALESAVKLAEEMDKMAKLTGMSREEQMKGLKEKQLDVQYQAASRLMMQGLDEKQRFEMGEALKAYQATATRLGGPVAQAMKEMATGGVRSKEAAEAMARLGPAGAELQKAFNAVKNATTDTARKEAEARLKAAEMAVQQEQRSPAFQEAVKRGDESAMKIAQSSQRFQESIDAASADVAQGGKIDLQSKEAVAAAMKKQEAAVLEEQKARAGTTVAIVNTNQQLANTGAALNRNIVEPMNKKAGDVLNNSKVPGTDKSYNQLTATIEKDKDGNVIRNSNQQLDTFIDKEIETLKKGLVRMTGLFNSLADSKAGKVASGVLDKIGSVIEGTVMRVKPILGIGDNRDTGTLGMTGKLFEPQDFFGKVQKGETVLTPEQLQNLVRGTMATASEKSAGSPDKLRSMMETKFAEASQKMSKTPSMSQITGGMMDKATLEKLARETQPPQPQPTTNVTEDTDSIESTFGGDSSLSEVVDELVQLNKNIGNLISLTQDSLENTGRQLKATKGLSGNLFA